MKYQAKSFSVPASAGNAEICRVEGHAMKDVRGRCIRCGEIPHDCNHQGHVWVEEDEQVFVRHSGRKPGKVAVSCCYCPATAELEAHARHTAPPMKAQKSHSGPKSTVAD